MGAIDLLNASLLVQWNYIPNESIYQSNKRTLEELRVRDGGSHTQHILNVRNLTRIAFSMEKATLFFLLKKRTLEELQTHEILDGKIVGDRGSV